MQKFLFPLVFDENVEESVTIDIDAITREQYALGFKDGENKAKDEMYNQSVLIQTKIQSTIEDIYNNQNIAINNINDIAVSVLYHVFPHMEKEYATKEISAILNNIVNPEELISIKLHPSNEKIVPNTYKANVILDDSMGLSDISIGWNNGGIERIAQKLLKEKIENIV